MSKESAVHFVVNKLAELKAMAGISTQERTQLAEKVLNEALEIEQKNIVDAFKDGYENIGNLVADGKKYYNKKILNLIKMQTPLQIIIEKLKSPNTSVYEFHVFLQMHKAELLEKERQMVVDAVDDTFNSNLLAETRGIMPTPINGNDYYNYKYNADILPTKELNP